MCLGVGQKVKPRESIEISSIDKDVLDRVITALASETKAKVCFFVECVVFY